VGMALAIGAAFALRKRLPAASIAATTIPPAKPLELVPLKVISRPTCVGEEGNLEGFSLHPVMLASSELDVLRDMMKVTDPQNLGQGRDVLERTTYTNLTLERAWRISKPDKKVVYDANKNMAAVAIRRVQNSKIVPAVETKLDGVCHQVGCDASANEKLLLHGTKPEHVVSILVNGLSERLSGGLFGCGVYMAEDPSKVDQYCTCDNASVADEHVKDLHERIYHSNPHPGGKIYYCFAVRVALGCPVFTKDGETDMHTGDRLWVSSDKRELKPIPGVSPPMPYHSLIAEAKDESGYHVKRHRELLTFNGDRTLLEYLIAFRRA